MRPMQAPSGQLVHHLQRGAEACWWGQAPWGSGSPASLWAQLLPPSHSCRAWLLRSPPPHSPLHLQAAGSSDGGPGTHCRSGDADIPQESEALGSRGELHSPAWGGTRPWLIMPSQAPSFLLPSWPLPGASWISSCRAPCVSHAALSIGLTKLLLLHPTCYGPMSTCRPGQRDDPVAIPHILLPLCHQGFLSPEFLWPPPPTHLCSLLSSSGLFPSPWPPV